MSKDAQNAEQQATRLAEILEYSPRSEAPTPAAFKGALEKLRKKKAEALEAKAMELLEKAEAADREFHKKEKEWNKVKEKHAKEFGKMMRAIEALAKGEEPPPEEPEPKDPPKAA